MPESIGMGFSGGAIVRNLPTNAGDMGSIPGPGGSSQYGAIKPMYHNY